jgi:hypothetical protein
MTSRRFVVLAALIALAPVIAHAQQSAPPAVPQPAQSGFASLVGAVDDSLRGGPLVGALVTVAGTTRQATTDMRGNFRIDSIAPGQHSIVVTHPLLDTLGLKVHSAPFTLAGGDRLQVSVRTPSLDDLREGSCPRGGVAAGSSMLVGRVYRADTDEPAAGAALSLVFKDLFTEHSPERVRNGHADATGLFAICGLPSKLTGSIQASMGALTTADVPVKVNSERLVTTMLSIGTPGAGSAVLKGKVTTKTGVPVGGAQVSVAGTAAVVVTADDGTFTLNGLPSGTHEAAVRKIGFAQTAQVVTLSARAPVSLTVVMDEAQVLKTVKVVGKLDGGLAKVGFTDRQQVGMGWFLTPDEIEKRNPGRTTDALRSAGGLRVVTGANGNSLEATRGPQSTSDGCLNVIIDHARFPQLSPGDVDNAISPDDLGAVEYYPSPSTTPPEFSVAGRQCATLVIWSKTLLGARKP